MQDDERTAQFTVAIYLRPKKGQKSSVDESEYWDCYSTAAVHRLISKNLRRDRCTGINIVRLPED